MVVAELAQDNSSFRPRDVVALAMGPTVIMQEPLHCKGKMFANLVLNAAGNSQFRSTPERSMKRMFQVCLVFEGISSGTSPQLVMARSCAWIILHATTRI